MSPNTTTLGTPHHRAYVPRRHDRWVLAMADTDDTSKVQPSRNPSARAQLEQTIEAEREQLLQARGVLTCLYEVLLHAEGDDAVSYAQAAHAVASLIDRTVERRCAIASR